MFELPEAKRVRRAELDGSDNSDTDGDDGAYDADLQARLNAQIARSLGLSEADARPEADRAKPSSPSKDQPGVGDEAEADAGTENEKDDVGDEEFAFRLFSTTQPSQKVVLEEEVELKGDGAIAVNRPLSYYVVTQLTEEQKRQYAFAAVTGDHVLARAKDRHWGLEMPWKVTKVLVTRKQKPGEAAKDEADAQKKRRPGKKQRISLRKRAVVKAEKKQAEAQKLLEKEEHVKDKKKRMNRLKKLRKRAKNKEAKLAAKEGDGGVSEGDSDASE